MKENLINFFKLVHKNIFYVNIFIGLTLIYYFHILPETIREVMNMKNIKHDTVYVEKTAQLQTKGSFIYFEGVTRDTSSFKIRDLFSYDTHYPSEIFDGYLVEVKSYDGGKYFIWSKNKICIPLKQKISGWFFTDNLSKFASLIDKGQFYDILYPITEKQ